MTVKVAWIVLGLVPAVLFVTGFVTWWVRVVRRRTAGAAIPDRASDPAIASLAEEGVNG
jgi:uncharacterized iron-regulated membrane protein